MVEMVEMVEEKESETGSATELASDVGRAAVV